MARLLLEVGDIIKADETWRIVTLSNGFVSLKQSFDLAAEKRPALLDVLTGSPEFVVVSAALEGNCYDQGGWYDGYHSVRIKQLSPNGTYNEDSLGGWFSQTGNYFEAHMSSITPIRSFSGKLKDGIKI